MCFGRGAHCAHKAANLCKAMQIHLPKWVGTPWPQLKCNLSIAETQIYSFLNCGCIHLMICLGYGAHRAHRTAIVLQMHPPVRVRPPWLQL